MFIPFDQMNDDSRVWVYQSNRLLTDDEVSWLSNSLTSFLNNWAAHGHPLSSSFQIHENLFLVLAVDENAAEASGCSIDASVHELQLLQQKLGINLFTRDVVVFKKDSNNEPVKLIDLKKKITQGGIQADHLVYNTLVKTKEEFQKNWIAPAEATWLKRYFKTVDTVQ